MFTYYTFAQWDMRQLRERTSGTRVLLHLLQLFATGLQAIPCAEASSGGTNLPEFSLSVTLLWNCHPQTSRIHTSFIMRPTMASSNTFLYPTRSAKAPNGTASNIAAQTSVLAQGRQLLKPMVCEGGFVPGTFSRACCQPIIYAISLCTGSTLHLFTGTIVSFCRWTWP